MRKELLEYLEKEIKNIPYKTLKLNILKNDEYCFESIIEANNCDIKIEESTKQILLSISKKDNNWISMYWVSKYLNISYTVLSVNQLKGNYIKLITNQIDNCINFIKNNIEMIDKFYKNDIENDIQLIRENARMMKI